MFENNRSTFYANDVTLLLTDITGKIEPLPTAQRENLIQSGTHYSEMLPLEYKPSEYYIKEYYHSLEQFAVKTAESVIALAEKIHIAKNKRVVLVSLARAGTPIGILIKRYLFLKYNYSVPHYTISIVRGRGIDKNAMQYILDRHCAEDLQFVDGWTGKGAILEELSDAVTEFIGVHDKRLLLAVLSDPANITELCGTHDDFPIASSFLNSTVCGLMSRTIMHSSINEDQFHGVVFYSQFKSEDKTYEFIEKIESFFNISHETGMEEVREIAKVFGVKDINFIKPGIGETTRVLLRRVPDIILVAENGVPEYVSHIIQLAKEKNVEVVRYPLRKYQACGIIKSLNSDI